MFRSFIVITVSAFFLTALAGCNTVQGMGKDIEKAGEKTQEAADAVRKKL